MSLEAGSAGEWAGAIVAALGFFFALLQLRSSFKRSEAAWEDLKEGTERAWSELAKATEGFVSRFK